MAYRFGNALKVSQAVRNLKTGPASLYAWEDGTKFPSRKKFLEICSVLGIDEMDVTDNPLNGNPKIAKMNATILSRREKIAFKALKIMLGTYMTASGVPIEGYVADAFKLADAFLSHSGKGGNGQ